MLYLGYVGFTVPFAFALGALIMRYPGEKWIHITRRWTMVTWGFLTCGIVLGMHWAYAVLGWGGYWGWDPVENASLLAMADRHCVSALGDDAREARHVESLEHVADLHHLHALDLRDAAHPQRAGEFGPRICPILDRKLVHWFLALITCAVCVFFFVKNAIHLRSEHKLESLVSRESSFLFNNLAFCVACFTVLWGTLFPKLSEWVQGT